MNEQRLGWMKEKMLLCSEPEQRHLVFDLCVEDQKQWIPVLVVNTDGTTTIKHRLNIKKLKPVIPGAPIESVIVARKHYIHQTESAGHNYEQGVIITPYYGEVNTYSGELSIREENSNEHGKITSNAFGPPFRYIEDLYEWLVKDGHYKEIPVQIQ